MLKKGFYITALLALFISGCQNNPKPGSAVMTGNFWKEQAINEIIPAWTEHAVDQDSGAFITNLDGRWNPLPDYHKYPSMIGRHIFSYSTAYLLTGDESYLSIAKTTKDFLLEHGWDNVNGGWFDVLNRDGSPAVTTKYMFIQTYALTGLAMYYFVTHDNEVLNYIERSDSLLMANLWDAGNEGFFNKAQDDWQVIDANKSFASEVAPVSGYMLYLGLATGDTSWFDRSRMIMDCVTAKMKDPVTGWILETFDSNWNIPEKGDENISVGHNLEVAWMLLRLSMLDNDLTRQKQALILEDFLYTHAFDYKEGFWYGDLGNQSSHSINDWTPWWIQAYGNMYSLCSFRATGKEERLEQFRKGAEFWNNYFIDSQNGDTYLSVCKDGTVKDSTKADLYKTSYHSMEQCLLNYMYLSLWFEKKPVTLYFDIENTKEGDLLYPFPIEDRNLVISKAEYETSSGNSTLPADNHKITLPAAESVKVKVTIENNNQ